MRRFLPIALTFLIAAPTLAEAPEGETLDILEVEEGWGDGRVTERDARAFCEFCLWGLNELRADAGLSRPLGGDDVLGRLNDFWVRVWEHVDFETKQTISAADQLWPAIRAELDKGDAAFSETLLAEFGAFAEEVWGGYEDETLAYLEGSLPAFLFEMVLSEQIEQMVAAQAASRARSGGGSASSLYPSTDPIRHDLNTSYVMNDGSGDIMYIDE